MSTEGSGSVTIILHSGDYSRASYALTLALVSLSMGMEAHVLLTHGGLRRFTAGSLEAMGDETPTQAKQDCELGIMTGALNTLQRQLADAKELGLSLYACTGAMAVMNLRRDTLLKEIDREIGLGTFLELARAAEINWYI